MNRRAGPLACIALGWAVICGAPPEARADEVQAHQTRGLIFFCAGHEYELRFTLTPDRGVTDVEALVDGSPLDEAAIVAIASRAEGMWEPEILTPSCTSRRARVVISGRKRMEATPTFTDDISDLDQLHAFSVTLEGRHLLAVN